MGKSNFGRAGEGLAPMGRPTLCAGFAPVPDSFYAGTANVPCGPLPCSHEPTPPAPRTIHQKPPYRNSGSLRYCFGLPSTPSSRRCHKIPMSKSSVPDAICADRATQIHGPAHEYIRLMRSYLSEPQLTFVRDQIEALARDGRATLLAYANLVRSCLTRHQRDEVVLFLGAVYENRGWASSSAERLWHEPATA